MKPDIDDIKEILKTYFTRKHFAWEVDQADLAGELDNLLCDAYFQGQLAVRGEIAEGAKSDER